MKTRIFSLIIAMLLLGAGVAWAGSTPGSGLAGSPHDFSSSWSTAVGLCTACHTPHNASGTRLLWNHTLSSNTYQWTDTTSTIGGTPLPKILQTWTGPTKYCLSCHDGSVAIGSLTNWLGKPATLNNSTIGGGDQVGANGSMNGNHPVAFPYPANATKSTYNSVTTGNAVDVNTFVANPMTGNKIRLFTDTGPGGVQAGVTTGSTGMECSSCHDPHNKTSVDDYFLVGKLGGDDNTYICLMCHVGNN